MACISKRRERYVIDFYDHTGKRRWETQPKGTTKTKAKERLRELEDQISKRIYLPDKKIPIFKTVAADWLEQKKTRVRESTLKMYKGYLKNHFEIFDSVKVNRITTAKVEKFITDKQLGGMNLTTLRKIIVTLNQIMAYSVRHEYIDHNPVRDAERPRDQGEVEKEGSSLFPVGKS